MVTYRAASGLGVLLVVAGCTGSGVQSAPPVSVTPAPVPTDERPTPAHRLAPGLAQTGVVGPLALATAHADRLRSTGYHVRIEERTERPDGTVRWRVLEGTFANRTDYAVEVRNGVDDRTVLSSSFYANGERRYQRLDTSAAVDYYVPREPLDERSAYPQDPLGSPTQFEELYVALSGSSPDSVDTATLDGVGYHHLTATEPVNDRFLAASEYVDAVLGYRFEAIVTDAGLVREYRYQYVADDGGDERRVVRTARWSDVGNVTVRPPDWYATALNRTEA